MLLKICGHILFIKYTKHSVYKHKKGPSVFKIIISPAQVVLIYFFF